MKPYFSVVIPVYQAEDCLYELYTRVSSSIKKIKKNYEIVMVNDGSTDSSWQKIEALAKKDKQILGIDLSRNFGQHYAITAGIDMAKGKWIIVMDCDLQDKPEEIATLYKKALEGYDIVFGIRKNRTDSIVRRFFAKVFFIIFDFMAGTDTNYNVGNFCICNRRVIEYYKKMNERIRSFPLLIKWLGFKREYVTLEHGVRFSGNSSYTFYKLIALSIDYITLYSVKPLRISIFFGFLIIFAVIIYVCYSSFAFILWTAPFTEKMIFMASIYFLFGLLFTVLGIVGVYIGNILIETRNRPHYIVADIVGLDER